MEVSNDGFTLDDHVYKEWKIIFQRLQNFKC